MTRREWLIAAGALPLATRAAMSKEGSPRVGPPAGRRPTLPDKAAFARMEVAYLNSGSTHPVSLGARAELDRYLAHRMLRPSAADYRLGEERVVERFARLINAEPAEIAFVQSTTAGEHLIVQALGLPRRGAHVVTDTLHFFGSFPLYGDLEREGVEVTWLRQKEGRIALDDVERAVRRGTRLVSLSLISTINGFEHDLKAVCDIAHARGALVYADIIHAAGCVPVDVKASGVDFAACSGYKWLMGDFGLGFLYVRKDRLGELERVRHGYYAIDRFQTHVYPFDPPGDTVVDYGYRDDARGLFATGTYSHTAVALLDHSLGYILDLGVDNIQAHARPLTDRLKQELPRLGYRLATPPESGAPMVACWMENARRLVPKLEAAKVEISVSRNRFRASVSVFNDMNDIDRLLALLA
ncbi:MAG TPA: aminotransferase class V-fold PLP-dependent enzyme [Woeseiaceae bacterium]|nr:aminotransferase class V-fold PLP-dependent enzyme [Woeseiaceae bacterium]